MWSFVVFNFLKNSTLTFTLSFVQKLGFGKISKKSIKGAKKKAEEKPYIAVGPPDKNTSVAAANTNKQLNDPSNPEYDDQGYTLYADEKTGKKSRVFEALVEYPCDFTMKIVGANEGPFVSDIVSVVAEACDVDDPKLIPHTTRAMGKWTSVTVKVCIYIYTHMFNF